MKFQKKDKPVVPELLNAEQIAARRIPLEDSQIILGKNGNWFCHYCSKRFTHENTFMRHYCEPKRRAQELASPLGQSAYMLYGDWMTSRKYSKPSPAAFLESKFFKPFVKFAQLIVDANIAKPKKYIELMTLRDIQPILWTSNAAYAIYMEYLDKSVDPLEEVQESIDYLFDICEKENIPLIGQVAGHLGAQRILQLVRQKRISPWVLFNADSFKAIIAEMDSHERAALNTAINATYWSDKFQKNKQVLLDVRHIAKEIGM